MGYGLEIRYIVQAFAEITLVSKNNMSLQGCTLHQKAVSFLRGKIVKKNDNDKVTEDTSFIDKPSFKISEEYPSPEDVSEYSDKITGSFRGNVYVEEAPSVQVEWGYRFIIPVKVYSSSLNIQAIQFFGWPNYEF